MNAIIIPTYNEAQNLPTLVNEIFHLDLDTKIIFIDDNSPDGTGKLADELAKKHKGGLYVLHRKGKLGLGSAYILGFKYALTNLKPDLIITMDADLSHHPKYIPGLINKVHEGFDVVQGSRYMNGGGVNWAFHRRIVSRCANLLAIKMLGFRINDITGSFRCYKAEVIKSLNLDSIKSEGFSFLEELLYLCKLKGFKVGEAPIFFIERKKGKSKLSKGEMIKFFFTIIRLRLTKNKLKKEND